MTTDPRLAPDARVIPVISTPRWASWPTSAPRCCTRAPSARWSSARSRCASATPSTQPTPARWWIDQAEPNGRAIKAVTCIKGMSLITVEGRGMIGVPGVAARTFGAVASVGANVLMISQASSEQSICFVVPATSSAAVAQALEDAAGETSWRGAMSTGSPGAASVVIVTAVGARHARNARRSQPGLRRAGRAEDQCGRDRAGIIGMLDQRGDRRCRRRRGRARDSRADRLAERSVVTLTPCHVERISTRSAHIALYYDEILHGHA